MPYSLTLRLKLKDLQVEAAVEEATQVVTQKVTPVVVTPKPQLKLSLDQMDNHSMDLQSTSTMAHTCQSDLLLVNHFTILGTCTTMMDISLIDNNNP